MDILSEKKMESVWNNNGKDMKKLIRSKFGEMEWNWNGNGMEHFVKKFCDEEWN